MFAPQNLPLQLRVSPVCNIKYQWQLRIEYTPPNKDNIDTVCMHLTNYAINKTNTNFVYNESDEQMDTGHKRSLTSVFKTLKERGFDTDGLWTKIKDMIVKTFISAQPVLSHHYKSCQPDNYANNMCF